MKLGPKSPQPKDSDTMAPSSLGFVSQEELDQGQHQLDQDSGLEPSILSPTEPICHW